VPIIFFILYFKEKNDLIFFSLIGVSSVKGELDPWTSLFLLAGLIVKFPLYTTHLWLPRAHVEAPLIGSVVLAALILKLAGYGLFIFLPLIKSRGLVSVVKVFSLFGGAVVRFCCIYEKDIKKLIAYTSVAHMAFVIYSLISKNWLGCNGAQLFIFSHGICSSGLFISAFFIYTYSNSRSLVFNFGFLSRAPRFTFFLFILCMANISGPPRSNFFAEIFCIIQALTQHLGLLLPISLLTFIRVIYSLVLYSHSQYGQRENLKTEITCNPLDINLFFFMAT